jgi:EAL domain-containing protein (putative c-di-GMP-specific phosphodiesterase class I)
LSYLRRFPITTLKIDRAFINDVNSNEEAAALVSAILSMAQSLKLKVVAEGVETQDQLEHLRRENCTYIQGYYFSPPVPVEAFRLMVKRNTPLEPDE